MEAREKVIEDIYNSVKEAYIEINNKEHKINEYKEYLRLANK